jgi:hypothetical protein
VWFLFVEIFVLVAISFLVGAGITSLALRMFLKTTDSPAPDAEGLSS